MPTDEQPENVQPIERLLEVSVAGLTARIAQIKAQKAAYIEQANLQVNKQVAHFDGQIAALSGLIEEKQKENVTEFPNKQESKE